MINTMTYAESAQPADGEKWREKGIWWRLSRRKESLHEISSNFFCDNFLDNFMLLFGSSRFRASQYATSLSHDAKLLASIDLNHALNGRPFFPSVYLSLRQHRDTRLVREVQMWIICAEQSRFFYFVDKLLRVRSHTATDSRQLLLFWSVSAYLRSFVQSKFK